MDNHMATIQKRGNAWRAFVLHNGRRYTATRDTKAEAKAWAIQCKADLIRQADAVESPHNAGHTVADALILYRDTITVNKRGPGGRRSASTSSCGNCRSVTRRWPSCNPPP